jgi:tetratricopeptide (TPR) repeat protein
MDIGKKGYSSQISLFMQNGDARKALRVSKEFVRKYPSDQLPRYLLALSSYLCRRYGQAAVEGKIAFNHSNDPDDKSACATIIASAYYRLGFYGKAISFIENDCRKYSGKDLDRLLILLKYKQGKTHVAAEQIIDLSKKDMRLAASLASELIGKGSS